MNKKHIIIITLLSIIILILGVILFKQNQTTSMVKISTTFLEEEISDKEIKIQYIGNMLKKVEKDEYNDVFFLIYNDALTVINLTQEIQKEIENQSKEINTKKIIDFLNDSFYNSEELLSIIKLLNSSNYEIQEKQYLLLLIKNYYLQECIEHFYNHSSPLIGGEVINYAKRDTVNLGEIYQSQILFNAIDIKGNIVVFENGDTIRYGNFEEKAVKKGHNQRKGYMQISFGESITSFYEVNIDYYVK